MELELEIRNRYDKETGLYYLNSRYYNPIWGRYLNADSMVGLAGELLSSNMFLYCRNNPVNMKDASGYWEIRNFFNRVANAVMSFVILKVVQMQQTNNRIVNAVKDIGSRLIGRGTNKGVNNIVNKGVSNATKINTPSVNTKVINAPEVKAPNAIKSSEVTGSWENYLGGNATNINPRTGQVDPNRIFSADATKSIRFDSHEMNSMGTTKFHYHMETWTYDAVNDTMTVTNTLQRIK